MNPWVQLRQIGLQRRHQLTSATAGDVHARQQRWLLDCLQRNRHSSFGRRYQFEGITSAVDFQQRVPLQHYEQLTESINAMASGEENVLFAGKPLAFERTSGSSGASKLIPYSSYSLSDFQSALLPWLTDVIDNHALDLGKAYWAISPVTRASQFTESGIPVGISDAEYLGEGAIDPFCALSAVPFWVAGLSDVDDWKTATLYHLLRAPDLVLVSVWSPTFLQLILDGFGEHYARLVALLSCGGTLAGQVLPADAAALSRLQDYTVQGERGDCSVLWPKLRLVSCWGDASSEPYFRELARQCPQAVFQRKGLLATEGVVTVPDSQGDARLCLNSGFYEFLDRGGNSLLAEELRAGDSYQLVITTAGGLYRYSTGDQVECTEEADNEQAPALRFLGRAGVSSDLVGEKLTDSFVSQCLSAVTGFGMLVPAPRQATRPTYLLLLGDEVTDDAGAIAERVEQLLKENPHYAYARRIGQLGALEVRHVSSPLERYMSWAQRCNTRLGDIKPSSLRTEPEFALHMGVRL